MSSRSRAKVFCLLTSIILIGAASVLAQTPEGVSPGAVDRITQVEGRCPTFIWGGVTRAQAFELVVYRLPDEPQASETSEYDLAPSDQVLYSKTPGWATAWQPELADGLEPGGSFVWFVRAVLREESGEVVEAGDWSAARFFSIPAAPSAMEVEEALEVLQRWKAANGDGSMTLSSATASAAAAAAAPAAAAVAVADSGSGTGTGTGSSRPKSVPSATAAIKGTIPDPTGETYGVVGISNSPDGAGVAAANTGGGPDLVLDGSADLQADTRLSQSGVDRPSASLQSFNIDNSGGGGIVVEIDGFETLTSDSALDAGKLASGTVPDGRLAGSYSQALTLSNPANDFTGSGAGLTGVDADTLDGTDGATFATDAEAAALVAAHAASAAHDGRYYTKTQLNTAGGGGAVNWNNLTAVPAGFADGVDNDTTYSPGPGLIIDNGEIRINPAAFSTRISTLDGGNVGSFNSIAIGVDGLGLISYFDNANSDLKVAHCNDTACSSATTVTLDNVGEVGRYTSIAVGADGLGLISYFDNANFDLKVAHCADTACSSATTVTLDNVGEVGSYTSIAIGADGRGLISYYDSSNSSLKVAHCVNTLCSAATTATLASTGVVTVDTSIAIGADGLGLISYYDWTNNDLKVAHCSNTACSTAVTRTLDSGGSVGSFNSIAIGADGLGLISYYDYTNHDLKVAHCNDTACSTAVTRTLDSGGSVGSFTSIAIGTDGLGLISYYDEANEELKVARCTNTACSSATTVVLNNVFFWHGLDMNTSIAIGADGLGLISYNDALTGDLRVAHLGIGVP